ncbi:uncharacterized protein CXQ87_000132 [Candidozyma duobushaemuli]|uniref:Uncharacterized protein n=2 Tax=Candidozyma TaxID=3303203 RepID=A0ABX8HYX6_9ASCO|nr:uncharacterized protein CXQ87_000132 [[Candida] duobushaemulonis]PVH17248.1 hypothetical protein CXQ87_000132 [[Candida] duobushaemulonis]QWU85906.1 hypothetical protein CA3LBN_000124 [[Candida] haemuloni]
MQDSQAIAFRMLRSQRYIVLLIFTALVTFLIVTSASAHSYIKESSIGKSVGSYVETAKTWANSDSGDSAQDGYRAEDEAEADQQAKNEVNAEANTNEVKDDDKLDQPKPGTDTETTKDEDDSQDVGSIKDTEEALEWEEGTHS